MIFEGNGDRSNNLYLMKLNYYYKQNPPLEIFKDQ